MKISRNSYSKGMNKDISLRKRDLSTYFNLKNFRLLTDEGESSGALVNIKGTEHFIDIPDTHEVYEIKFVPDVVNSPGSPFPTKLRIVSNDNDTYNNAPLNVSPNTTYQDVADYIGSISDVNIYVGSQSLILTGTTGSLLVYDQISSGVFSINEILPAQTGLIPIGWENLRDDIYIFTTNETIAEPTTSAGQIWKLTYDKVTEQPAISLIYNNIVNFSTFNPIANPGQVVSRYENSETQRLYWTDNYNLPRKLNVADPNAFAVPVGLLEFKSDVDLSVPILEEVKVGGVLDTGVYQFAYQLTSESGAESIFSQASNIVHITDSLENGTYQSYSGAEEGTVTNKAIRVKISNIDENFDTINFFVIKRTNLNDTPEIYRFDELPVDAEVHITFTGNEDLIPISINEYTIQQGNFYCKTLTSKDNHLFAGNIREIPFKVDYDTRAYRFNHNGQCRLYDAQDTETHLIDGNNLQTLPVSDWGISEEADAINPYNNENPDNSLNQLPSINGWNNFTTGANYKFKADGQTFGGQGPNVEYEFVTKSNEADVKTGDTVFPYKLSNKYPSSFPLTDDTNINEDQDFPQQNTFNDFKSPTRSGTLRGYQRGELYRFGCVFIDYAGNESAVQWIGDIKMPYPYETDSNDLIQEQFPLLSVSSSDPNRHLTNQLGIKFTFNNLDDLTDKVKAIKIIRVKREQEDKFILGQSPFFPCVKDTGSNIESIYPQTGYTLLSVFNTLTLRATFPEDTQHGVLHPPETLFRDFPEHVNGDRIKVIQALNLKYQAQIVSNEDYYLKSYENAIPPNNIIHDTFEIVDKVFLNPGQASTLDNYDVENYIGNNYLVNNSLRSSSANWEGASGEFIKTANNIPLSANEQHLIVNYIRYNEEQYNGNTYNIRQNNEYISCSNYIPINNLYPKTSIGIDTFGGDTFCTIQGLFKFFPQNNNGLQDSLNVFYPVESTINTDLRHGFHYNTEVLSVTTTNIKNSGEEFEYNTVYSAEHDTKKYFPLPPNFLEIEEYDNRIWASGNKINGEIIDSWGIFKYEDIYDVEGEWGPINNLITFNDTIYYFQDRGFGRLSVNPNIALSGQESIELPDAQVYLGTGTLLHDHQYISNKTGCKHQKGMVVSDRAIYWFDVIGKKLMRFAGDGTTPLSDIKGMNSYFRNQLQYNILKNDNPLIGEGITGTYDYYRNEVWFTFRDRQVEVSPKLIKNHDFTVVYSESIGAFQGFYGHTPTMYINDKYNIISPNPDVPNKLYIHGKGNYGVFYDNPPEDSEITIVVNPNADFSKVFDRLEYLSESYDTDGNDIPTDTISEFRVFHEHQDTNTFTNPHRDFRTWRIIIPRDNLSPLDLSRIRNPYAKVELKYNNSENNKLILHDILTHYRLQPL